MKTKETDGKLKKEELLNYLSFCKELNRCKKIEDACKKNIDETNAQLFQFKKAKKLNLILIWVGLFMFIAFLPTGYACSVMQYEFAPLFYSLGTLGIFVCVFCAFMFFKYRKYIIINNRSFSEICSDGKDDIDETLKLLLVEIEQIEKLYSAYNNFYPLKKTDYVFVDKAYEFIENDKSTSIKDALFLCEKENASDKK